MNRELAFNTGFTGSLQLMSGTKPSAQQIHEEGLTYVHSTNKHSYPTRSSLLAILSSLGCELLAFATTPVSTLEYTTSFEEGGFDTIKIPWTRLANNIEYIADGTITWAILFFGGTTHNDMYQIMILDVGLLGSGAEIEVSKFDITSNTRLRISDVVITYQ